MKIERVETFLVDRFLVVRVTTDDGTEGIGESCYWAYPRAAEETIKALGEAIIGMDPADTEHLYNYMHRYNGSFRGNSIAAAISGIDMALWDIKGKRLDAPVWDLLGGRARQKIRAIFLGVGGETPDEVAERAKIAVDRGYTALKFTPMPREFQLLKYPLLVDNAVDMLAAVRETVGNEFDIGVEIHRNMRPSEAVVFCEKGDAVLSVFHRRSDSAGRCACDVGGRKQDETAACCRGTQRAHLGVPRVCADDQLLVLQA